MSTKQFVIPLLLGLLASTAQAQAHESRCAVTLAGASYHFDRSQQWRENNPGVGVECSGWAAGYYRNSYDKDSFYAAYAWRPVELGPVRAGLIGGLITGYDLPVMLAPSVEVRLSRRVAIELIGAPSIGKRTAFVAAQIKLGF